MTRGQDKSGRFATTYMLSSVAACVAEISTFPFDIIKTRLQAQALISQPKYRGFFATGVGIFREEGMLRLYRGLSPACLRHCIYSGFRVMSYEVLRDKVFGKNIDGSFPLWKGLLAGMCAGAMGQFFASPTDLVKVQLQLDGKLATPRYSGTIDAFKSIYRRGGMRGLWKGWVPNCQRAALVQMGDLTTYDASKQFILRETDLPDNAIVHTLASGISGVVAATLGAPSDVIKTRIMNQPTDPKTGRGVLYHSSFDCLKKTVSQEGFMALYKGWFPTWMRMAPWSLIFFLTFEQARRVFGLDSF
eukprot:GSMAST32.ASY1.ANO1.2011.1 assembled CDS